MREVTTEVNPLAKWALYCQKEGGYILLRDSFADNFGIRPRLRGAPFSPSVLSGLMAVADGLIVFGCGLLLYAVYLPPGQGDPTLYLAAVTINTVLTVVCFHSTGLYSLSTVASGPGCFVRIALTCAGVFLALIFFAFALKLSASFSRVWMVSWLIVATSLICLHRGVWRYLLLSWGRSGRMTHRIAIVGGSDQGMRFIQQLNRDKEPWMRIVGIFDDRISRLPASIDGYPVLGDLKALIRYARRERVDDIIVALPWAAEHRTLAILRQLQVLPVRVRLCPDSLVFNFPGHKASYYGGVPVLNVFEKPLAGWGYLAKRFEDFVLGVLIFMLVLPAMLFIGLLVKLDSPGPALFRQRRRGFNNELIEILKFRTMHADQNDKNAEWLVTRDDPRVTRFGAFLRKTSLDELPQVLNVLRGDMSIVGPRPHALQAKAAGKLYHEQVVEYALRYRVKPGITGWAQINGWRGETDTEDKIRKRVEHDLFYIDNWSLALDLKILLCTIGALLRPNNAY